MRMCNRFSFSCVREDGISGCFSVEGGIDTGKRDNSKWRVNASEFAATGPDERYDLHDAGLSSVANTASTRMLQFSTYVIVQGFQTCDFSCSSSE